MQQTTKDEEQYDRVHQRIRKNKIAVFARLISFCPLNLLFNPTNPPFFFRCLPLLLCCYEMYVGGGGFHLLLRLLLHVGFQLKETRVKSYIGRGSSDDFISLSKESGRTRLQSKRGQIDFKGRRRTIPMTLQVS